MNNVSRFVLTSSKNKHESRFISSLHSLTSADFVTIPNGVFGTVATVKSGNVTLKSSELDIEFTVPFDDDMEANEAEIIVYNLSKTTISGLKNKAKITIEAGYKGDTGVIFSGFITKVTTKTDGSDRATTIKCLDNLNKKTVENISFAKGTKASAILKSLLKKTETPIAVFKVAKDHTYKESENVDGDLFENIKKYADVCGISVFVSKGKIYARSLKEGDNLNFELSPDTGLIESVEEFEEERTVNDKTEIIKGYKGKCLLQHRLATAGIVKLKTQRVNGTFRVRSGQHTFNSGEAVTEFEVIK